MSPLLSIRYENAPAGITFDRVKDADGDSFWIVDIEGHGSMEIDANDDPRHGDGSSRPRARYKQRELNIIGMAEGNRAVEGSGIRCQEKLRKYFADWRNLDRWLYLDFSSPGLAGQYKTQPGGALHLPKPKGKLIDFEVPFTCLDPRFYSQTTLGGSVNAGSPLTIANNGTTPTWVTATLNGTATDPWLQVVNALGTYKLQLSGSIPNGTVVDFFNKQTVHPSLGGINLATTPRAWWFLTPGNNTITSVGSWTLTGRHAYR